MMTVGSANETQQAGYFSMNRQTDSVSRNIQKQIANEQKRLQELSSNREMTPEEKMKKRQEIQQEINNLNQQLRQHQIELRRQQQTKDTSADDMLGGSKSAGKAEPGSKESGLSQANMQAMISADSSMKQAQVQGSVATKMEGTARVLESEIKMDRSSGAGTEKKEAALAKVKQKAVNASASQMNILADANQTMAEAAKAEQKGESGEEEMADEADKSVQESSAVSENTSIDVLL